MYTNKICYYYLPYLNVECILIVLLLTAVLNAADLMLAVVFNTANSLETFDDVTIRGRHVLQALRVL